MKFSLEIPLNGLSFGQTAMNILRECYKRKLEPNIFPTGGNGDLSAYEISTPFKEWIERCILKANSEHTRSTPTLKLWHLNGGLASYSDKRVLLTFHETDTITPEELNAIHNNDKVIVTSNYTRRVFESVGADNVVTIPLGFDDTSFFKSYRQYNETGTIAFGIGGKLEKRKHHIKILQAWVKKYGNNGKYKLNCAVSNPHLDGNMQAAVIGQALEGKVYHNLNFIPFMKSNRDYNDFLNSNNIYIAMSGGEGFDLPAFQSLCLGKHIVSLDAHVYQDYLDDNNACIVKDAGKEPVYDGVFFHPNQPFNQGNIFTWNEDDFIAACEQAEARFLVAANNKAGELAAQKFSYKRTVDEILDILQAL